MRHPPIGEPIIALWSPKLVPTRCWCRLRIPTGGARQVKPHDRTPVPKRERGGASLSLPSWWYPPPRGNLSPVSRPPVSAPLRLVHRATDGHDRSHDSQRVACRTARRTPAQPPAACVAAAGLVALAAVALLCGPAARATRSTPPRGGPRLRVPTRSDVRSVGFMRAAAHRRRRR